MQLPVRRVAADISRVAGTATAIILLTVAAAPGEMSYGPLRLSSQFTLQSGFQHAGLSKIDWVQQRQEYRLDVHYRLLERLPGQTVGSIDKLEFAMLYRARYDAIFDIRDSFGKRGFRRDDFRFPEGKEPREIFLDLSSGPLSARIGRQQVVWGEADFFRSLDVVNPLRLDQVGIVGDDLDEYREPLWIAKFLYNWGELGPVSDLGIEAFYSPNSRPLTDRAIVGQVLRLGLPDNNILTGTRRSPYKPFHQVRFPWEVQRIGNFRTEAPVEADLGPEPGCDDALLLGVPGAPLLSCADIGWKVHDTWRSDEFNFHNSMVGVRLIGKTFANIDFTLNYLFKKTELPGVSVFWSRIFDPNIADDGSFNLRPELLVEAAAAEATLDSNGNGIPDGREELIRRCIFEPGRPVIFLGPLYEGSRNNLSACAPVKLWYPWTHIVGFTLTYNDSEYSGMILRTEQSFSFKEPRTRNAPLLHPRQGEFPTKVDFAFENKQGIQVWRSMIGFDYYSSYSRLMPSAFRPYKWLNTWFMDPWFLTFQFFNEYYSKVDRQVGLLLSLTDRQYHWNPIFTLIATGFFLNSRYRPLWALGWDFNTQQWVAWLDNQITLRPDLKLRVGWTPFFGSSKDGESILFLHKFADRDFIYVRLTYFLL